MYLSKISFATESAHRLVMAGFPETDSSTPRADWGILYRQEPQGCLLVQSQICPDWSNVLPPGAVQTKNFELTLGNNHQCRFRLAFNSVKRSRGQDVAIAPSEWLAARDIGATLDVSSICTSELSDISSSGHRVRITRAIADGTLTVTNADRLLHVITHGIGRGRAYGCGLLTLA